jgi:hypothetical protein
MAKMLFDLQRGVIEVDGEEQFVERVYTDLRSTLLDKVANLSAPSAQLDKEATAAWGATIAEEPRKARKRTKNSGPSCASRIDSLKADHFFDELRSSKDIGDKLREKGTAYEGKHVAAALISMTAGGKLRRVLEGGVWKYQNP